MSQYIVTTVKYVKTVKQCFGKFNVLYFLVATLEAEGVLDLHGRYCESGDNTVKYLKITVI